MVLMETFLIDKDCIGVNNLDSFMFGMLTDAFIGQPDERPYLNGIELQYNIDQVVNNEDFYILKVGKQIATYVSVWTSKVPMSVFGMGNHSDEDFTTITIYTTPEFRGQGYTEKLLDYIVNQRKVEVYFCKWNNQRSRNLAFNQNYEYVGDFDNQGERYALYKTDHCPY